MCQQEKFEERHIHEESQTLFMIMRWEKRKSDKFKELKEKKD